MKKFRNLLPIFFLAISQFVSATNYYVDNTNGLDSNTGLSSGTAWKTLAKVNASFSIFVPGDAILFKRGEIFAGTLTIAKSGTASNPITFGAYGTGADPDISGFTTLSSWTSEGNNIYSKTVSLASTTYNIVSVNGVNTPLGRYPNAGSWLTLDGFGGNTQLTDAAIDAASTNWTGAEVVIRPDEFRIERALISSHSSHTLTFSSISEGAVIGNGYFIQNDLRTLDVTNEWYYNGTKFYIYGDPSTRKVSVSAYTNGVVINSYDNIVFDHLKITGYGKNGFDITDGSNITIKNCSITFCGETAIYGYDETNGNSAGCIITDNLINQINSNGIYLKSQFTNSYIARNTVKNIGLVVGAPHATGWEMAYNGILLGNDSYPQWGNTNAIIELNKVDSIGYSGILMYGTKITARYNFVNHFGMKLNDGGGIYTYSLLANPGGRTGIIRKNIVLNGMGNHDMTQHNKYNDIRGIYMDGYTRGFTVDSNTVAFCSGPNFFINGARSSKIKYNTIYDARAGSPANLFLNEWTNSVELIDSMDMQYNKIISKDANESAIEYVSSYGKPASSAIIDNNYYARPMDDNNIFYVVPLGNSTTLAGWRTYSSQDANSNKSPLAITDTSKFDFYYNPDITSKVITLAQPMIDIASTKYANSITLSPYSSAVLIVDPAPSQTVIPVYTGSVVQSGSPSLLEVTYDVTLANIIPAASAFSVQVNSVARTVNSVTLSGSKVTLALSSPVVYGDVVKMSYTKPSVNPLQSTSGGQAASLVGQTVTNRVASLALPTYVSSSIENATPGILTLVYNMTLAPIVPSTSAFTVKVNSVVRAVNSVSISGTNVSLTLEYGVAYGVNITVDYT
ncbi:MAG: SwmB domain-containing protein [Methanococcaceae archaeon]